MLEWTENYSKQEFIYNILHALYILFAKIPSNNVGYKAIKHDFSSIFEAANNMALRQYDDPHEIFARTEDLCKKFGITEFNE